MSIKKKTWLLVIGILSVLILLISVLFTPRQIVKIEPKEVSKITIQDGSSGTIIEITDEIQINYLITNLNSIKYNHGNIDMDQDYNYKITIYGNHKWRMMEVSLRGRNEIVYHGFTYQAYKNHFDIDYVDNLFG